MESRHSTDIPKKILYLGLEISEPIEEIINLILTSLKELVKLFNEPDAIKLIKLFEEKTFENLDNYKKPWKYPKDYKRWHVTTLFKNGKKFLESHPAFKSFIQDKEIDIQIRGILYIPSKIITSLVYTNTPVQNEFPHMTTLLGEYSAKNSNDVCNDLFSEDNWKEIYNSIMQENYQQNEDKIYCIQKNILNNKETLYFMIFGNPIIVRSRMKMFSN